LIIVMWQASVVVVLQKLYSCRGGWDDVTEVGLNNHYLCLWCWDYV